MERSWSADRFTHCLHSDTFLTYLISLIFLCMCLSFRVSENAIMGRVRIDHSSKCIDFAPGVSNIVLRRDGIEFYSVETFHSSPFYDSTTPVLAIDLINSKSLYDIYGYSATRAVRENVTLLNNHPVRRVRLMGWITEYSIKEIRGEYHYLISLDDSTGEFIQCLVQGDTFSQSGLTHASSEGKLVEIFGYGQRTFGDVEVKVESLRVIDDETYLSHELIFWNEALEVRKLLHTPWFQTAQIDEDKEANISLSRAAQRKKLIQKNIQLSSSREEEPPIILDSSICIMKKNTRKPEEEFLDDQILSPSSDIEEITQGVFQRKPQMHIPLRPPQDQESSQEWESLFEVHKRHKLKGLSILELTIKLMLWMYQNVEPRFHLNKAYQDPSIQQYLKLLAEKKFSQQVVDLTSSMQIRSLNEIHGELFHKARHELQRSGLIICTKSKMCTASTLIDFIAELEGTLREKKRKRPSLLNSVDFVSMFNQTRCVNIEVNKKMLQWLIYQLLMVQGDLKWWYKDHQWAYES